MFGFEKPKVLEEVESKFSGTLKMTDGYGDRYVATGIWTQSGGVIKDVWNPVLKKFKKQKSKGKTWLILGLATGTVAKMIAKDFQPAKMVGVEIDPAMLYIGNKYFGLADIPRLEIVNLDAQKYKTEKMFDIALIDMYLTDQLPKFVYGEKFLQSKFADIVVFNHLFETEEQKQNAQKLIAKLQKIYKSVELVRVLTNVMIICA